MTKTKKREIKVVCSHCGISANVLTCLKKYGRSPKKLAFNTSTFHTAVCDVCGEKTELTEVRDFFYPDFNLLITAMEKACKKIIKTNPPQE